MWWDANGASCPELQYLARHVLSHPASASIIERINSEFAFDKDPRRNKLEHGKANKLAGGTLPQPPHEENEAGCLLGARHWLE